ncbi:hypothetical protein LEP1GSC195_1251 [Leptospira wolbachii serovar Codice str. CDC]|uniref:Uncharacterized protein n=1 Tax=Leptospira wolbachii serovar Codice str. CDC TaxID=1218599 RepID=R9A6Y0_9LEPT|nr:hypothetical protein LEP1GSC195_1251 [Leptospira wolbachii serovar Codice str. CDC]
MDHNYSIDKGAFYICLLLKKNNPEMKRGAYVRWSRRKQV